MNKSIKKTISVLAYIWAAICVLIVFIIFLGSDPLSALIARLPFVKVDPIYTGGEIVKTYRSDSDSLLLIQVHEPVFSALIGESRNGFIQLEFVPSPPKQAAAISSEDNASAASEQNPAASESVTAPILPQHISEIIDYDSDGVNDFALTIDTTTGETILKACPSKHLSVSVSTRVQDHWQVRIALPNPRFASTCSTCSTCPMNQ